MNGKLASKVAQFSRANDKKSICSGDTPRNAPKTRSVWVDYPACADVFGVWNPDGRPGVGAARSRTPIRT